ncbi:MAG: nitroreductase [Mediterranea sp.]|jgi:nitroreductase|nr:nitroreductase [Mediterranea sp.]
MMTNEVLENIKARRSVRAYTDQPLPEEALVAILEAATYAPSGMHLETWHFTAVANADKLVALNERIKGAFAKSGDKHLQERGHNKAYNCYYHAPALVIVSNETTQWWAGLDCACAIENMFLAACSLGIGSCWINQLGTTCDDPEVRAFLTSIGVPENHKVYGCVALGYADPKVPMREKKIKAGTVTVVR